MKILLWSLENTGKSLEAGRVPCTKGMPYSSHSLDTIRDELLPQMCPRLSSCKSLSAQCFLKDFFSFSFSPSTQSSIIKDRIKTQRTDIAILHYYSHTPNSTLILDQK